jgi:hypothetical protein
MLLATGCVHRDETVLDGAFVPAVVEHAVDPTVVREVVVAHGDEVEPVPTAAPLPLRASPADHPPPDPVPFRIGAGHGALGRVDLAPCREQGLQPGYVHMRVTFRRDGRVVHASVEAPAPPPPEALDCIGEQLELAMVPVFDGRDVTLSRSFFVNPSTL